MDISSWQGYAFEQVCLHHIQQIKTALGISGILANVCSFSWQAFTDKTLHLTMITSEGLEHNEGWHSIQSELTLDDLFR